MNTSPTFSARLGVAACAPELTPAPKITISTTKVQVKQPIQIRGTGFTPEKDALSHLKRPTGQEYPVIPMFTNDRGEFSHEIDTLLLDIGIHELWVVDSSSGVSSNIERFEVTLDQ